MRFGVASLYPLDDMFQELEVGGFILPEYVSNGGKAPKFFSWAY